MMAGSGWFLLDEFNAGTADFSEKISGAIRGKFRIARFQSNEKTIVGGTLELLAVE